MRRRSSLPQAWRATVQLAVLAASLAGARAQAQGELPSDAPPEAPSVVDAPALEDAGESPPTDGLGDVSSLETEVLLNAPVITATGREVSRALAPANVVSFERAEIERHGWTTLAEVLANTPGLYVVDDLVLPSVGVRGVTGGLRAGTRIVKVMVNGVAVNFRPDLTSFIGPEYIPMDAVERIEIAKGPLSALYGANAFLATVNVITRRPAQGVDAQVVGEGSLVNGNAGAGGAANASYSSDLVDVLAAVSLAQLDRSGSRIHMSFDAQREDPTRYAFLDAGAASERDRTTPLSAYVSSELRLAGVGVFQLQGGRQSVDSKAEFQPGSVFTHKSRVALVNDWASLAYIYGYGEALAVTAELGLSHGAPSDDEVLFASGEAGASYTRNFAYTAIDGGVAVEAALPLQLELEAGADYSHELHDVLYFDRRDLSTGVVESQNAPADERESMTNVGVYVRLGGNPFRALPALFLSTDARFDDPNLFGSQLSWRLGGAYQWSPRLVSKAFVGRAFQVPSAVQLFARPGFGAEYDIVGNRTQPGLPPLQPQSVLSLELANTWAITNELVLDASVWYQDVEDKIEFVQGATNFRAENLCQGLAAGECASQKLAGGEVGVRASSSRLAAYASLAAQLLTTFDAAREESSWTFQAPPEFPQVTALGGVLVRVPEAWLVADVAARLVGERGGSQSNILANNSERYTLPSYFTLDLTVSSLDLFLIDDRHETRITASIRNVLDERFLQPGHGRFDIPSVGRAGLLRLSQAF